MEAIYSTVFGNWKPDEVNLLINSWMTPYYVPSRNLDCKGAFQHYIPKRFSPSRQLLEHTKRYKNLFLHSRNNITAVMLRFEHMLFKIKTEHSESVTVESCLEEVQATVKQMNTNIFVSADIGKYGSNSWNNTLFGNFNSKRASEIMNALKHTLSGLVTDIEIWENSFVQATGGIVDRGYIAALQRTLASTADCIILVGGGNFQSIVLQEFIDNHPNPSQRCIYSICVRKRQSQAYQKYILGQQMNLSSIQQEEYR